MIVDTIWHMTAETRTGRWVKLGVAVGGTVAHGVAAKNTAVRWRACTQHAGAPYRNSVHTHTPAPSPVRSSLKRRSHVPAAPVLASLRTATTHSPTTPPSQYSHTRTPACAAPDRPRPRSPTSLPAYQPASQPASPPNSSRRVSPFHPGATNEPSALARVALCYTLSRRVSSCIRLLCPPRCEDAAAALIGLHC